MVFHFISDLYFIMSMQNKPLLIVHDYLYRRISDTWYCKKGKCGNKLAVIKGCLTSVGKAHNHPNDCERIKNSTKLKFSMKLLEEK